MKLFVDPRSSASMRVLTYLDHKGICIEVVTLDLVAGEHHRSDYITINPSRSVPALDLGADGVIAQSLAILEFLESRYPLPTLVPLDEVDRARVQNLCSLIGADIHPITNMRVRKEIERMAGAVASRKWSVDWTERGLEVVDAWVAKHGGLFSVGDTLTLADFFVVPLYFNARRLGCNLADYENVTRVYENCIAYPAFDRLR